MDTAGSIHGPGMRKDKEQEELIEELYRQIGQLKVELDWFSRYVLSWELSITLEMEFCLEAHRKDQILLKR